MLLTKMRPEQLQDAVRRNVPVLMAAGVVEYHGPHLPIGTDYLITEGICIEVEKRCECVLAPSLPFGPTLSWAGAPEDGEADFAPEPFFLYAKEVLRCILKMGFQRIYILQHHQGSEGLQSLCLRKAAAELVREKTATWGAGWGRKPESELPKPGIFSCIQVCGLDDFSEYMDDFCERIPIGHAGKGETQLIMASNPETVRMEALKEMAESKPSWLLDAYEANSLEGRKWLEFCICGWVKELT